MENHDSNINFGFDFSLKIDIPCFNTDQRITLRILLFFANNPIRFKNQLAQLALLHCLSDASNVHNAVSPHSEHELIARMEKMFA